MTGADQRVSAELARHLSAESEFEQALFLETIQRINFIRRAGPQAGRTRWLDWVAPVVTGCVILIVYFVYVYARF